MARDEKVVCAGAVPIGCAAFWPVARACALPRGHVLKIKSLPSLFLHIIEVKKETLVYSVFAITLSNAIPPSAFVCCLLVTGAA